MRPTLHRHLWAAISLALLLFCASGHATITVIDYYRLGEADAGAVNGATVNTTSQDSAGTKHLTRIGSPIYTNAVATEAALRTGSQLAIQFSGSGQGLSNAVLSTVTDNFGLEAWARSFTATGNHSVAYNGNTATTGWGIYQLGANYSVLFGGAIIFGSSPVTVNGWTHLALVRASGTNTLYVNGVAAATNTAIPNIPAGGFGIAQPGQGGGPEGFNGQIDEVRVFTFAAGQFSPADLLLNTPLVLGQVQARKTSALLLDADANGKTNPGDTLRYTITITNTSGTNLLNVQFNDTNFPNQTLVGVSIKSTPVARPDAYTAIGNTLFNVPATSGVLTNDSDPDGDAISVVAYSPTSAHGGTVTVTNNGGFTFLPPVGYQGPDTFNYTISDGNGGSNTTTVTLTISNLVWYVNNAGVNGDGRQPTPFNSFASLNAANGTGDSDGTNDTIYLFTGNGSYGAGLVLEANQRLVGAGSVLLVGGTTILPAGSRPTLGSGGAGVICAANNIIQGLNINATAGKGIAGTNIGTLTVTGVAVGATGGAALDIDTGTVVITLDSAASTNSPADGIRLNALNGFVLINGGILTGAAGTSLRVTGTGNAGLTFPGHLSNTTGRAVEISGHTNGTITLSGNITNSGTGILIQNNSGGTIVNFTGTSVVLNTGVNPAVNLVNNTGTTLDFANGGLVVTTTSGTGFSATGGATAIAVRGPGNTINAGTGSALNVVNTTIGTNGLMFQRLASSGGSATGIILDNTGTNGGVTVTGTGSPATGGTIANKSGADGTTTTGIGLYLNNTRNHAFSWMQINDCQNFGLRGVNVTSVTMSNLVVNGTNGTSTPNREGSVIFDNAFGTCALVNSTVRGSIEDNFRVENDSGTLTAFTVSSCTIGNNSTNSGNIGVRIASKVSAVMTASVRNCTFQGNRTDSINCDAGDNSTLTIGILTNTIIAGAAGNNQGNLGIDVTTALNGVVNFNIDGNRIGTDGVTSQPLLNTGINVFNGTLAGGIPASMTGTVRGNTVMNAGAGQSGFGIRVFNSGYGKIAANVAGNTISNVGLDYGMLIEASSNSGTAAAPCTNIVGVTSNTVNVLAGALDAIRLQARGRGVISARINGNSSNGGGAVGGFKGLEIRQANQTIPGGGIVYTATFNLEGLTTGLQNNLTTIVNYLKAQNPAISLANCDALFVTGITGVPTVSGIP